MKSPNQELTEIRKLMERSTRFISLSGVSGIFAGLYALLAAWVADKYLFPVSDVTDTVWLALGVLILSLGTAGLMSIRNARKKGIKIFSAPVRLLLINLAIPLLAGGILCIILLQKEYYELLSASMLIFYGLALVNASKYSPDYLRLLGILQIIVGLLAAGYPEHSLLLWSIGFGWLHIGYSAFVYWKYER